VVLVLLTPHPKGGEHFCTQSKSKTECSVRMYQSKVSRGGAREVLERCGSGVAGLRAARQALPAGNDSRLVACHAYRELMPSCDY